MKMRTLVWMLLGIASIPSMAWAQFNADFDAYMQKRLKAEHMISASMAYIHADGSVTYKGYGSMDVQGTRPVNEKTIYEIGSISKTFTAGLMKIYMQKKKLQDDTPIQTIFKSVPIPQFNGQSITIGHLVSHTSGLPRLPENMDLNQLNDPYKTYTYEALFSWLSSYTLQRAPGEKAEYSNLAFMMLGRAVEELAKKDFDKLIETHYTKPLKMHSTGRLLKDSSRFATPTNIGKPVAPWNFDELRGLGELRSTAEDMAIYVKAMLGHTKHADRKALDATWKKPLMKASDRVSFGFSWFLNTVGPDTIVYHGGGTGGFRSFIAFNPKTKEGVVVLTNSNDEVQDIGMHLLTKTQALREVIDTKISEEARKRLLGKYQLQNGPIFTIFEENERLFGQMTGQTALPLSVKSDTILFNRTVNAELHFRVEPNQSTANQITLHQAGQKLLFLRTEAEEIEKVRKEISLSAEVLKNYVGTWKNQQFGLSYTFTVSDGKLMAQLSGQPAVQVFPESEKVFFYKVVPAELVFELDETGKAKGVVLNQNGQKVVFE